MGKRNKLDKKLTKKQTIAVSVTIVIVVIVTTILLFLFLIEDDYDATYKDPKTLYADDIDQPGLFVSFIGPNYQFYLEALDDDTVQCRSFYPPKGEPYLNFNWKIVTDDDNDKNTVRIRTASESPARWIYKDGTADNQLKLTTDEMTGTVFDLSINQQTDGSKVSTNNITSFAELFFWREKDTGEPVELRPPDRGGDPNQTQDPDNFNVYTDLDPNATAYYWRMVQSPRGVDASKVSLWPDQKRYKGRAGLIFARTPKKKS